MAGYTILKPNDFPPKRAKHGAPTVHFDIGHGVVYFSMGICRLMELKDGDRILVVQSEQEPSVFGFKKTDSEDGFLLRKRGSTKVGLCFVCITLVRHILSVFGSLRNTMAQVGTEPEDGFFWLMKGSIARKN